MSRPAAATILSLFLFGGMLCAQSPQKRAGASAGHPLQPGTIAADSVARGVPQKTIDRYCLGCHNEKVKSGGLALEPQHQKPEVLEKVVRRMRAHHMPPVGLPRPDENTYSTVINALETSLDRGKPDPGRIDAFRRLNRTEYQNAIRDLLALDVDVSSLLPSDDISHGFDNVTVGNLSPTLLERYLSAARKISRLALGIPGKSPGGDTVTLPPDLTQETHFNGLPVGTRGGTVVSHNFPVDAEYDVQIRLARDRNEHVEGLVGSHDIELMLDGKRVRVFTVRPPPSGQDHSRVDQELKVRIPVKAGPHEVATAFLKKPSTLLETERQPYQAHFNMDRHPRIQPAVYSVSINGPYNATGVSDTPSRKRILVCSTQDDTCTKKILLTLMRRAYRRPVNNDDLLAPMKFYREGGLEMALSSILVSPEFLFRIEQDPAGATQAGSYKISELELASRLSFFLWSSIPDDELLDAAAQGKLRANIDKHVQRMLADPRSRQLVTNFAGQWLYLRNLATITPDMRTFPDFDDNLRQAFRTETEMFVESVMRNDRSVLELLNADYTFVNERLAKHYGIPNIYGSHFRRVTVADRGGLLRHGSILTVTSYATRTSPVVRGKWIMENLLGAAPPPPPPDVPVLTEKKTVAGGTLTMRERISEHRRNPACSGCHNLIDPVGFSLENYDAVGRWRSTEDAKPIDASGGLPDGTKFVGVAGLQNAILARPELFITTFTEKLLTYGLGRGVEYYDQPSVRKITREAKANGYRFSSFILGIVNSTPFQMRRSQT
jgi:hypothetical protein